MGVQKQVKDNAEDVNDFLKDLDSWAADMTLKDNKLREQKLINSPNKETSSVDRSSTRDAPTTITMKHNKQKTKPPKNARKEKETKSKGIVPSPPKKEKIKAYEYDKWDRFDVDDECSKVDAEASASSSDEEMEMEEVMQDERLKQQAVAEKERGNEFFKQGKLDKAIERYTAGMQCNPYCPLLPANRAMALLKKGQFSAAEQDASLSLSLDPTYIKAIQRRASARIGLNKIEGAIQDYKKILELEPSNKQAASELAKLETPAEKNPVESVVKEKVQKLNLKDNMKSMFKHKRVGVERLEPDNDDGTPSSLFLNQESCSDRLLAGEVAASLITQLPAAPWNQPDPSLAVNPVSKPSHLRSKKPLKRVDITEIRDSDHKSAMSSNKSTINITQRAEIKESSTQSLKPKTSEKHSLAPEEASNKADTASNKTETALETSKKSTRIQIVEVEGETKPLEDDVEMVEVEASQQVSADGDGFRSKSKGLCRRVEKELNQANDNLSQVAVPCVPKTSAQFYRDWRSIKDANKRFEFLCQFTADSYLNIFKNQMESSSFSEILSVLAKGILSPEKAADHVIGLSQLPRISTLVMFLDTTEKENLRVVLLAAASALNQTQTSQINRIFKL